MFGSFVSWIFLSMLVEVVPTGLEQPSNAPARTTRALCRILVFPPLMSVPPRAAIGGR